MSNPEENRALILRAYEEIWSQGNLDAVDEIVSPECEVYSPRNPEDPAGIEEARLAIAATRSAFPDLVRTAEEMVAEGDKVVVRSRITGTHQGDFQGMAPTGKEIDFYAFTIYGIRDGRIAYEWTMMDSLGLMQQLDSTEQ